MVTRYPVSEVYELKAFIITDKQPSKLNLMKIIS
jgi:hypothetical protein